MAITINDLREDWEHARQTFGDMIAWIVERGGRIHSEGQTPETATTAWLVKLRADYDLFDRLLRDYPAIT